MLFTEETQRLILKVETEEKAADVLAFYQRNKNFFTPFEPTVSNGFYTEAYQQKFLSYEMQDILNGTSLRYFIYLKNDPNTIIGSVNLCNILHGAFSKATLGYKLDYAATGNGYATEAVLKLLQIAAVDLKLHRIEARVVPENLPSIQLLNRLHFQYEGVEYQSILVNNTWRDLQRYSLILY